MAFHMGGDNLGSEETPLAEINIIPLVDVMLVLLIITMITSPFLEQGVNVELPVADGSSLRKGTAQEDPVTVYISKDRNIRIGKIPVPREDFSKKLGALFQGKKEKELFVRADKVVPYGVVASVMAEIQSLGIERVGLVTQNE